MKKVISTYFLFYLLTTISAQGLISEYLNEDGYYARFGTEGIISSRLLLNQNTIQTERNMLFFPGSIPPPLVLKLNPDHGNVTIGDTDEEEAKLTVRADDESQVDIRVEGTGIVSAQGSLYFRIDESNNANEYFVIESGGSGEDLFWIGENGLNFMRGNLAIGDPLGSKHATGYRLSVDGNIISEEVRVDWDGNWPDYVFQEDYKLMPLSTLKTEIYRLGHLPDIPSAKEVEAEGFDLGNMNKLLLEKIEELTLHVINLQDQINVLKDEN